MLYDGKMNKGSEAPLIVFKYVNAYVTNSI